MVTVGSSGNGNGSKLAKLNLTASGSESRCCNLSAFLFRLPLSLATLFTSFTTLSMNTCWRARYARMRWLSVLPVNNWKYSRRRMKLKTHFTKPNRVWSHTALLLCCWLLSYLLFTASIQNRIVNKVQSKYIFLMKMMIGHSLSEFFFNNDV